MVPALILAIGCAPSRPTVQPVVDARAARMVELAEPGVSFALGAGGLVASVCALGAPAWRELDGELLVVEPAIEARLAVEPGTGLIIHDPRTGDVFVSWEQAQPFDAPPAPLELQVVSAGARFVLNLLAEEPGVRVASVAVDVASCEEEPSLTINADVGESSSLQLPFGELPASWAPDGDGLPLTGVLRWSRSSGAEQLVTADATTLIDGRWPGVARSADWTQDVELELGLD